MQLDLNEKEIHQLLEAVSVYEWIVNSVHDESDPGVDEFCQSIFQKIKKVAPEAPIEKGEDQLLTLSEEVFQSLHDDYIEPYNEFHFWSDLAYELGMRDLSKKVSESQLTQMSEEERDLKLDSEIESYEKEFESHGVERLYIKK
ncbi:hypothetical protein LPTSP4_08840 [Leptospira ryugenii]|uniref:Uncharacterized protein n=1 Tax=Leptospira ryugenii TaxID=1917863 RepID=A0A2P2DXK6_9LEPT|nr:hypothetical protein [Leptospira ryugenii]GBF49373.1 hypothetical protein LPTSP4_08840 [Leptospira ryugenii]